MERDDQVPAKLSGGGAATPLPGFWWWAGRTRGYLTHSPLVRDDIHELAGDDDDLSDGFSVGVGLDVFVGEGLLFGVFF